MAPHLLYQAAHKGRARLLGGCPLLSFRLGSISPLSSPSLHAMRWGRMLLGGSPQGVCVILGAPPSLHAVRWERTLLWRVPRSLPLVLGGALVPLWRAVCWEHTMPAGGSPPSSGISPRPNSVRGLSPAPSSA